MRRRLPAAVLAVALAVAGPALAQGSGPSADDPLRDVFDALARSDRAAARSGLEAVEARGVDGDDVRFARAYLAHMDGEYQAALDWLDDITAADDPEVEDLRRTVAAAARWMRDAREVESAHFRLRYPAGVEEVIAQPALEVLEAAYEAVGDDLGLYPEDRILVEIYPTSMAFAESSGLPMTAMANDTIALCRWDRLLVTSPMAAPFGYPWADTLCHEYTHLVVNRLGAGGVPVWLHEGIAAFEQRRWRGVTELTLDPYERSALTRALRDEELVSLAQIGNCLACLDTKEQVGLAFAQVHTMVDYLVRARGMQALRDTLATCRLGVDAQDAVAAAHGGTFAEFEAGWRTYVEGRGWFADLEVGVVDLQLDGEGTADDDLPAEDSLLAGNTGSAGHARLGDLLLDRGERRAALLEYGRAEALLPVQSPSLACRKAYAYRELGELDEALAVLERAHELYPEYHPVAINLAAVQADAGQPRRALESYRRAALLNPFDPRIYAGELALLDPDRDPERVRRARAALDTLQRHLRYDGAPREPAPEGASEAEEDR